MTAPQVRTDEPPGLMVAGDAPNEAILGVPLQPTGAGGTVGCVRVALGTGRVAVDAGRVDVRVGVGEFCAAGGKELVDGGIDVPVGIEGAVEDGEGRGQSDPTQTMAISERAESARLNACA